jgi:hypothetical protein
VRKSDGVCRINAVAVTKIVIEGEDIAAQAAQLGEAGDPPTQMTFGNMVAKTGWPEEVTELASQLREAIEDHFAQVLFEEDYYDGDHSSDRGDEIPAGLVQFGLGAADDGAEQL